MSEIILTAVAAFAVSFVVAFVALGLFLWWTNR